MHHLWLYRISHKSQTLFRDMAYPLQLDFCYFEVRLSGSLLFVAVPHLHSQILDVQTNDENDEDDPEKEMMIDGVCQVGNSSSSSGSLDSDSDEELRRCRLGSQS